MYNAVMSSSFELKTCNLEVPSLQKQQHNDNSNSELYIKQICENSSAIKNGQVKNYNLGNTYTTTNPLEAADYLLEREYGDIFDGKLKEPVFIPPVFESKQFHDKDIPELTGDIEDSIKNIQNYLSKTYPNHWLTKQIEQFILYGKMNNYDCWNIKMKLLYIVNSSSKCLLAGPDFFEPTWKECNVGLMAFANKCVGFLKTPPQQNVLIGHEELIQEIQEQDKDTLKEWLKKKLGNFPSDQHPEPLNGSPWQHENLPGFTVILKYMLGVKYTEAIGEEPELFVFQKIKENQSMLSDFVILRSLDIYINPKELKLNREHDFLLLSAERKLIIAIEVKRTLNGNKKKAAKNQLKACKEMFEKNLRLGNEWSFHPVIFAYEENVNVQEPERRYIINQNTDFKKWLQILLTGYQEKQNKHIVSFSRKQLKETIKVLVFCLHKCNGGRPITTTNWVDWTQNVIDSISTTDTIMFYSKDQLEILYGKQNKTLIIDGGFGTGKSILLQEKAQMLATHKEKVYFIIGNSNDINFKCLLQLKLEELWKNIDNITVKLIEGYDKDLQDFLDQTDAHVFIDELLDWKYDIKNMLERWKHKNKYLWVVLQQQTSYATKDNLPKVNLNICFRNTKEIIDSAIENTKDLRSSYTAVSNRHLVKSLKNIPSGKKPKLTVNTYNALVIAKENGWMSHGGKSGEINNGNNEFGILYYVICNFEVSYKWFEQFYPEFFASIKSLQQNHDYKVRVYSKRKEWQKDESNNDVIKSLKAEECLNFLQQPNSILIVDNEEVMEGFQWPVIIYDRRECHGSYLDGNAVFRSTVQYILIQPAKDQTV